MAESGAEAPVDESILKKDLAAEEATAAEAVDSDRAKAMFAAHKPSANAVFWSKLARSTDPPAAPNGVTTNAPVLKPVIEDDAPALEPVTAGGAPLPSIKDFSEEPGPAASASRPSATRRRSRRTRRRSRSSAGASAPRSVPRAAIASRPRSRATSASAVRAWRSCSAATARSVACAASQRYRNFVHVLSLCPASRLFKFRTSAPVASGHPD